jgi:hypothetical protein
MWQTVGLRVCAEGTWLHPEDHVDRLCSDFDSLDQGANQLPSFRPVGLLQSCCDTLGKLFQIADHQPPFLLPSFLVGYCLHGLF